MAQKTPEHHPGLPAGKPLLLLHPSRSKSQHLRKGSVYFIAGTARFGLIEGKAGVAGATLLPGDGFTVPRGRALPVEALSDAVANVKLGEGGSIALLGGRTIPAAWDALVARVAAEKKRTVLLLGETDTGKTFFAAYLANRLAGLGAKIAVLDCDTGQSAVGPPGTIGLGLWELPVLFLSALKPQALYFTGSYSPGASFLEYGMGIVRMMRKARSLADTVIVNTPGWVQGDGGRLLVRAQCELFSPDLAVLFQREKELEYAARLLPGKTAALPVPAVIPARSPEERKFLREQASREYFRNARLIDVPFRQAATDRCYFRSGEPLRPGSLNRLLHTRAVLYAERLGGREGVLAVSRRPLTADELARVRLRENAARIKNIVAGAEKGLAVALNDLAHNVLALGIVEKIEYTRGSFKIITPLPARLKAKVRMIQFGLVKLTPDGGEAGAVEPGYF